MNYLELKATLDLPGVAAVSVIPDIRANEIDLVRGYDPIRQIEIVSIYRFVEKHRGLLVGRVLDFGCGKPGTCRTPQPYRAFVGGEYIGVDIGDDVPEGKFDAILCTQVAQFVTPWSLGEFMEARVRPGGWLVMTFATNWPEVEDGDQVRYTASGMEKLLRRFGFDVVANEARAGVKIGGNVFNLGHGILARRLHDFEHKGAQWD